MGQLRKRGGVWQIRYYRNGRRYEESAGTDKKGVATELLRKREGDGAHGLPVTPKTGRLWFEEATKDLLNDYRINGKKSLDEAKSANRKALDAVLSGTPHGSNHDRRRSCVHR